MFGVGSEWLPVTATAPPGSGFFTQLKYLILPVIPLVLVLFGYIARMARAGTVEALDSDYARTAMLKGLPRGVMIRRHVLRNSLLPTITVIATQTGLPDRRPRRGRDAVPLQRHRDAHCYNAATQQDIPMLEACVLTIGVVYMIVTLVADICTRCSIRGSGCGRPNEHRRRPRRGRRRARGRRRTELVASVLRELLHSPTFIVGAVIVG